ncbi:MAG: bifunctional metallophosphatase/5'-nucleotidase [Planctomycetota bacterium]|jgi:2',3'-cyclic-nucleotide 2'-phosphodiesterase (5'-nucleotidase family)
MHPDRKTLLFPLLLALLTALFSATWLGGTARAEDPVRLTICHTNDMHGYMQSRKIGRATGGGIARVAGAFREVKREVKAGGGHAYLVDAGDFYAGTPEGNLSQGRLCIEMMNAAGYAVACPGNHEFDDGTDNFEGLAKAARFPFVCANILEKKSGKPLSWLKPYVIREAGPLKVAFLGALTVDTKVISGGSGAVTFEDEVEALRRAAAAARKEGAHVCVALTHVGFDRDMGISKKIPEIALLVGGHSHTYLKRGRRNRWTGVLVVQAGGHATHLGRVDLLLSPATGEVISSKASLVYLASEAVKEDPEVRELLAEKSKPIRELMDRPIGKASHAVERGGRRFSGVSSPLGNLLADLMREGGEADLGFHNRTGIRNVLPAGPVTLRHVYGVCPFGNTIFTMDLSGSEVLDLLEYALKAGNRYLLEISGGEVIYDPARPEGERVIEVQVKGKPLDLKATYRVATSNFIAGGGDAHDTFLKGRNRKDTGKLLRDLLAERIREASPLRVDYKNRIFKG